MAYYKKLLMQKLARAEPTNYYPTFDSWEGVFTSANIDDWKDWKKSYRTRHRRWKRQVERLDKVYSKLNEKDLKILFNIYNIL